MVFSEACSGEVDAALLFESLQSVVPVGLGLIDLDWRFAYVNPRLAAMNGLAVEEHLGRPVREIAPALWSQVEPALTKMRASGDGTLTREFVGTSHGAPTRMGTWLNVFYPVHVEKVLAGIGFLVLDLTEHRQPEELRSVIMQSIVEGLIAIDGEGRLTCMNTAAEQMLGWREDELRGRDLRTILHLNAPDDAASAAHDCPLASSRTKRLTARPLEDTFVCRGGRLLPVLCDATPVPGMGVVIMFRDASEEIQRRLRAETALDAVTWVGRIREALDEDRMEIYSQPIISLAGAPDREELLLRMITRDGQVLSAGAFLPAAEEFGLILEIDRWVIAQAVRLAARGRLVHVNLSAASTTDGRLLEFIEQELRAGDAPPANVIFELTETALMGNMAAGEAFAAGLRALGCGLVLDDFGTGFGTFTYLKRLPVQSLKIDVDFVRELSTNPANQHLVQAILSLARSFAIDAIAEGVEDEETLTLLRAYGVQYAQGYHIGRPLPCA